MLNPMTLEGKAVLVTGAGQGIGRAISQAVLDLGGSVVAFDRNSAQVEDFAAKSDPGRVLALGGDVTDSARVEAVVDEAVTRFGQIDGLVNNAGISIPAMIHKMEDEAWDAVLAVNLTAPFHLLRAVGRKMLAAHRDNGVSGSIVNVSSDAGRRGTVGQINYGASKSGLNGITMSAAREWGARGIRVNAVAFGVVETDMTETVRSEKFRDTYLAQIPMGRWGRPEEVALPVCFLLSDASRYVTGQILSVNGGYHISS